MALHAYKIVRDYGFAPNPFGGYCTLATCKPAIRAKAEEGDLVVGCGSVANGSDGRVICAMRVAGTLTFQEYWDDERFSVKKVALNLSHRRAYGDNIYHKGPNGVWVQEDSHHSQRGGLQNIANLVQDTQTDRVIWADEFVYWGSEAPLAPANLHGFLLQGVRDHRSNYTNDFLQQANEWFDALPKGRFGRPSNW